MAMSPGRLGGVSVAVIDGAVQLTVSPPPGQPPNVIMTPDQARDLGWSLIEGAETADPIGGVPEE